MVLFFMAGLENERQSQKCHSRGEKPTGICHNFVASGRCCIFLPRRAHSGPERSTTPHRAWRGKKAAGSGIAKDKRASSGRQRPGTFSEAAKSPVSLSRKSGLPCHGPVRRRLNSLMPQSRRLSREFHRSRRCPKPVVVASGCCRRRCGGRGHNRCGGNLGRRGLFRGWYLGGL